MVSFSPIWTLVFPSGERLRMRPHKHSPSTYVVQGQSLRPVAQIAHSYIVAESEGRPGFNWPTCCTWTGALCPTWKLLKSPLVNSPADSFELDLGADGARILSEYAGFAPPVGFDIEALAEIRGYFKPVPAGLERRRPEALIQEILADVEHEGNKIILKRAELYHPARPAAVPLNLETFDLAGNASPCSRYGKIQALQLLPLRAALPSSLLLPWRRCLRKNFWPLTQ